MGEEEEGQELGKGSSLLRVKFEKTVRPRLARPGFPKPVYKQELDQILKSL